MSRKADGTRVWLFRREIPLVFMMFRDKHFKEISIDIPQWTIVDAELMQSGSIIVFDILALKGQPVWFNDLKSRIAIMETLSDNLTIKPHFPLTETSMLLSSQRAFRDHKIDGLVFTPNTSYMFDGSVLLFKLQTPDEITFDIDLHSLKAVSSSGNRIWIEVIDDFCFKIRVEGLDENLFESGGIAVCSYVSHDSEESPKKESNDPIDIYVKLKYQRMRYDKLVGNASTTIRSQLKLCLFPIDISGLTPRFAMRGEISRSPIHPAKSCSFEDLKDLISSSPAFTTTTTPLDSTLSTASRLTVVNCRSREVDPSGLARGLVIDPSVEEVVAVSFPRFYPHQRKPMNPASSLSSVHQQWECEICSASNATVSTTNPARCYKCRGSMPQEKAIIPPPAPIRASVKFDGSMVVAYMRHGVLHTNTKKRCDSQQAIWARKWLLDYAGHLHDGMTYIFEAVFKDNQIVLEYPLESLFLLAIFDVNAREIVDQAEKRSIATELRIPLAPCIFGSIDILCSPKYLASKEGWVIETLNEQGAWFREKLISPDWKVKSRAVHLMNPTVVWRSCGKKLNVPSLFSRSTFDLELLASDLPPRYRAEWDTMADHICSAYKIALDDIGQFPNCARGSCDSCFVCGCSSEFDAFGDRICFCDPCRNAGACITRKLRAFSAIRPDPSSASSQVPGYEAPAFLLNNFAKGWVEGVTTDSASCPLTIALNEDETQCVLEFLCAVDKASFRTLSLSADKYIRKRYLHVLEHLHHRRVREIEAANDFESRQAQRRRSSNHYGGYGSDHDDAYLYHGFDY